HLNATALIELSVILSVVDTLRAFSCPQCVATSLIESSVIQPPEMDTSRLCSCPHCVATTLIESSVIVPHVHDTLRLCSRSQCVATALIESSVIMPPVSDTLRLCSTLSGPKCASPRSVTPMHPRRLSLVSVAPTAEILASPRSEISA